jgi:LPS sulfotransferase NodH
MQKMETVTRFILLSRQRSGSTVIVRSLDVHPEIFCAGEIFHPGKKIHHKEMQFPFLRIIRAGRYSRYLNFPLGILKTSDFLETFYMRTLVGKVRCSGFKLMLNQIKLFPLTKVWLNNREIKKIVLVRENVLDILISDLRAKVSGVSHLNNGDVMSARKVALEIRGLKKRLKRIEKDNSKLYEYANREDALLVKYGDLSDWNTSMRLIFDYLGVESLEIPAALAKRSANSMSDNISNFEEVVTELQGSEYDQYLTLC